MILNFKEAIPIMTFSFLICHRRQSFFTSLGALMITCFDFYNLYCLNTSDAMVLNVENCFPISPLKLKYLRSIK